MHIESSKYSKGHSFKYIDDIISNIVTQVIESTKVGNQQVFFKLLGFLNYTIMSQSQGKSIEDYARASISLISIYSNLTENHFKSEFVKAVTSSLLWKIEISNTDLKNKEYEEYSFLSLISIQKKILQEDNFNLFQENFKDIDDSLFSLEKPNNNEGFHFAYIISLLSWMYYLFYLNEIKFQNYSSSISLLENRLTDSETLLNNDFIDKFFNIFDEIEKNNLWNINNWEVNESPIGEVYFALMPNQWLPISLTLILLKFDYLIPRDYTATKTRDRYRSLSDKIKKILDDISLNKEKYVKFIFDEGKSTEILEKSLKTKKEKILNLFSNLKKEAELERFKIIKDLPLSIANIKEFRNEIGDKFDKGSRIISIIKDNDNIILKNNDKKIKGFGYFQTIPKGKFFFVDDKKYYQKIFGLSNLGSSLARSVEKAFLNKIKESKESVSTSTENIKSTINEFIDNSNGNKNYFIIANWRLNEKMGIHYTAKRRNPYTNVFVESIPILNLHNQFKNEIFIIDFDAIKMEIYQEENDKWYKNNLLVEVTDYEKGPITNKLIKELSEQDNQKYSKEEVDILESNNVNIKIIFKFQFLIENNSNLMILRVE